MARAGKGWLEVIKNKQHEQSKSGIVQENWLPLTLPAHEVMRSLTPFSWCHGFLGANGPMHTSKQDLWIIHLTNRQKWPYLLSFCREILK